MQNLVAVSYRVMGVCRRSQKSGALRLRCLWIGDVHDLVETAPHRPHRNTLLPHTFYDTEFGCSRSDRIDVGRFNDESKQFARQHVHAKIFLTSVVQNLIAVSHTVCAQVPKISGGWGLAPSDWACRPLETRSSTEFCGSW